MDEAEWDRVVGDIYDAAMDAEGWAGLPARLAPLFGASMCTIWSHDASSGRPLDIVATTFPPEGVRDYAGHFYASDPWLAQEHRAGWDVALSGSALVEDRALAATGYYADFGRRHETFHLLGSRHQLSVREAGIASKAVFCRPRGMKAFSAAEFALMDRLIPHLRRAWQVRHQIAAAGDRAARTSWEAGVASALLSLPGAALATDGHGRVLFANAAADRLGAGWGCPTTGMGVEAFLRPATGAERTRLRRALADVAGGGPGDALLLGTGDAEARRVVVAPLPTQAGGKRLVLVLVTPLALDGDAAAVDRAVRLLGLTRAEAEVTLSLACGLSPGEIADARKVGIATVRTLLLRAQGKLGARDLRGLVTAATLLRNG